MTEKTTIICPVCQKTFESPFALEGHLRLTTDPEHRAYRQQQNETMNDQAGATPPIIPHFTGGKLIDQLETFITKQKNLYGQEVQADAAFQQLTEIVERERTVENDYNQLIEEAKAELEQERQKVREELYQHYQQDVEKAVASAVDQAVARAKEELLLQYQKELDAVRAERKTEVYTKGYQAAILYIPNPTNGQSIPITIGSPLQTYINKLVNAAWVSHPEECQRMYTEQIIFYMKQEYMRKHVQ